MHSASSGGGRGGGGGSSVRRRRSRIVLEEQYGGSEGEGAAEVKKKTNTWRWDLLASFVIAVVSGTLAVVLVREELQVGRSCGLLPLLIDEGPLLGGLLLGRDKIQRSSGNENKMLPFTVHTSPVSIKGGTSSTSKNNDNNNDTNDIDRSKSKDGEVIAIRSSRVVLMREEESDESNAQNESPLLVMPATIVIRSGRIVDVLRGERELASIFQHTISLNEARDTCTNNSNDVTIDNTNDLVAGVDRILDFGDLVVMAGLVDPHVHLNEPGRESWEGFHSGTRAAAAGGITSLVDMPLNSIPSTIDEDGMTMKLAASYGKLGVDVAFWGGLIDDNVDIVTKIPSEKDSGKVIGATKAKLIPLLDSGVAGLKAFMSHPGTEEFTRVTAEHIEAAIPLLMDRSLPFLVHAELEDTPTAHDDDYARKRAGNPTHYRTYSSTRPSSWEKNAVQVLIDIWEKTRASSRLHIVHVSDAETVEMITDAKKNKGLNITLETAPHYLYFSEDDIPIGSTLHKCAPPIRSEVNREALWDALLDRKIDMVASDHSPAPPEDKEIESGDFLKAWGGIASLQLTLPAVWTEGRHRGLSIDRVSELMSLEPAKLAGLRSKGSISIGRDADFAVWDPETEFVVDKNYPLFHRHPETPYRGAKLSGKVRATFVRGQLVFLDGKHSKRCCGKYLLRNEDF